MFRQCQVILRLCTNTLEEDRTAANVVFSKTEMFTEILVFNYNLTITVLVQIPLSVTRGVATCFGSGSHPQVNHLLQNSKRVTVTVAYIMCEPIACDRLLKINKNKIKMLSTVT
jgi:hypothetical protein